MYRAKIPKQSFCQQCTWMECQEFQECCRLFMYPAGREGPRPSRPSGSEVYPSGSSSWRRSSWNDRWWTAYRDARWSCTVATRRPSFREAQIASTVSSRSTDDKIAGGDILKLRKNSSIDRYLCRISFQHRPIVWQKALCWTIVVDKSGRQMSNFLWTVIFGICY